MNHELPDIQVGFRMARGTRDHISDIRQIIEKARVPEKHLILLTDDANVTNCVDPKNLWKFLQEMGIPDHLTCLQRNLYGSQKATVRTGHGTMDWFKIGKGVHQAVYCHPAYLTYMQSTS